MILKVVLTKLCLRKYSSDNIKYNKWAQKNNHYQKIETSESIKIFDESFDETTWLFLTLISLATTKANSVMKSEAPSLDIRHWLFLLLSAMLKATLMRILNQQLSKTLFL